MRVPPVRPVRRRGESRFRVRPWMVILVVVLVALFLSARGLAGFYTDYLWFDSVGFSTTWRELLWARFAPAAVFAVVFFVLMFVSLTIADRLAPHGRALGPEDEMLARYQTTVAPFAGRLRLGVSLVLAILAGTTVVTEWQRWVLFTNAQDFGIKDPQFQRDVGFYVFRLPFLTFLFDWLFAALIIVLVVTALAHYLNGGIRLQSPFQRVTPQVKAHLSVILAAMALVKTAQYYLARFDLNFSTRGVVQGASKTDIAAELPAINLLLVISVVAAGLFVWNIWRRGWVLPVIAVGLWGFVSLVIGTVVPAVYQQFFVQPNELAKEKPYIARNIKATRDAFDLSDVKSTPYEYRADLDAADLVEDSQTIGNSRLWEPSVIAQNFQQFQSLYPFYRFRDADADRYVVDGQLRQVLIAARELNREDLPSQSWLNRHVVYTHGYGAVISPANAARSGQPDYLLKNIPGKGPIPLEQPGVYFGEGLDGYTLVGARQKEFDYAQQSGNVYTRYEGKAGVGLSSWLRRAAFALRFGDQNLLISSQIDDGTRILFRRDVRERVEAAAPFLHFDSDMYPVVADGRLVWVVDGYTASNHYPYSQSTTPNDGTLAGQRFNYIRNSVKVTVDAYEGTIKFFVVDQKDPIVRAYASAFPDLFSDLDEMPRVVREHLRYPEDLFRYQTDVYTRYHVTQPNTFFSGSNAWEVSADPTRTDEGSGLTPVSSVVPQDARSDTPRAEPLYVLTRLPGRETEEFLIIRPFVPASRGNSQNRLSSFMVARSDPAAKVRLESFEMPSGLTVAGPVQVDRTIQSTNSISREFTLIDQRGSKLQRGAIQIIPVKNSLLYIQPVYVVSEIGQLPALRSVVVFYDGEARIGKTLEATLLKFPQFSGLPTRDPGPDPDRPAPDGPTSDQTVDELLDRLAGVYAEIEAASQARDLGTYQDKVTELGEILEDLASARADARASGPASTTSTSTSTTTRPAAANA